jgi:hypothetical protein
MNTWNKYATIVKLYLVNLVIIAYNKEKPWPSGNQNSFSLAQIQEIECVIKKKNSRVSYIYKQGVCTL